MAPSLQQTNCIKLKNTNYYEVSCVYRHFLKCPDLDKLFRKKRRKSSNTGCACESGQGVGIILHEQPKLCGNSGSCFFLFTQLRGNGKCKQSFRYRRRKCTER